jgi:hypothetical protein
MAQQKFTAKISGKYSEEERVAIGIEMIDAIIDRTKSGKDKNNRDFKGAAGKYSTGYKNSFDFKLGGKSKSGPVNLTLSGEMLDALTVLGTSKGEITIGIPADDDFNNKKAEGNITGSYGRPKGDSSKARDFMGMSKAQLKEITTKYPTTKNEVNTDLIKLLGAAKAADTLADSFFDIENFDVGEFE